jgi:Ca2+:H+ antiporter
LTSPDIARVVETARRAAAAANHAFTGTEHLLAAALTDADGAPARALTAAGVSLDGLAEELLAGLPAAEPGAETPPPLSRYAERAVAEAEGAGGNLLAVLLRAPRGRVASALARRGANLQELRGSVDPARPAKPPKQERPSRPEKDKNRAREPEKPAPADAGRGKKDRRFAPAPTPDAEQTRTERRLPPHLDKSRPRPKRAGRRFPTSLILLLAIPVSVVLNMQHASPVLIFITACVGVLPLAGLMGKATEEIAERTGPTIGGLLNATFGNAAELIIAIVALRAGLVDLVKASITGSILGNLLLILGLSLIAGGTRTPFLKFNRTSAGMSSAMLALAVAGLVFPALFHSFHPNTESSRLPFSELQLSEAVAVILAVTYGLSLLFSLKTHKTLFGVDPTATPHGATWTMGKAILVLGVATAGVVVESEILVHAVEGVTARLGLSEAFLGLIIIPIIGNAAEHATAIVVARKGQTDLALQIALGSSTQVALLVAPLLVFAGLILQVPLNLVFTPFEVVALGLATVVVAIITLDGESHWFEGAQLLALYGMIGAAAFFL